MLKYFDGSVFNAPVQAIVNTVNTMGAMGAGIALEFSLRYPDMFDDYVEKCKNENIKVGKVEYLNLRKPFKRFWQIGVEKPIKGAAYKKIFNFFYNYKPEESEQLSLF